MEAGVQAREPRSRVIRRRLVTVPAAMASASLAALALPLWLPILALVDLYRRRRFASVRTGLFLLLLLLAEAGGLLGALWVWLRYRAEACDSDRFLERNFRLQCWWARTHMTNLERVFGVTVEIDAAPDFGRGPVIVLMRHASLADALLGTVLFSVPHATRLRYVMKQELLSSPCLDIIGNRMPNVFVSRGGESAATNVEAVRQLATELGLRDGVLIYPEGTRFTPERRDRILDRLRERGESELLDRARQLRHMLPPRPGGTLALLEAAPKVDVALVVHVGFETATGLSDLWSGRIIGTRVQVRGRRVAAEEIPEARRDWLLDQWDALDTWVGQQSGPFA